MPCIIPNRPNVPNAFTHTANVAPGYLFLLSGVRILLEDNLSLTKFAVSPDQTDKKKCKREKVVFPRAAHEAQERLSPGEDLAPRQKNSINTLRVTFLCSSEEANGPASETCL